ncbi:MAG: 2,4-dihydroxyhept-2-ene-1,7-dioic acid aldolase [Verrucomicrobia bacterium]|nr:2,4-dihydroxyhept-2-ene-1,7-dioic acid aldolase [Verrucomicrobiota bacterium]
MSASVKDRLKRSEAVIGSWMQLPDASVAELMGAGGFDWVALDMEHGAIGAGALPDLVRGLEAHGTEPFARIAQGARTDIKQVLDAGCRGVIVPSVESREQVQEAVAAAKYPPEGSRGVGYSRANLFGRNFATYFANINREVVVVAQIESIRAIGNLEAIVAVPGLDALMVGPYDLSASMGLTGQFDHPEFKRAMETYESVGRRQGIPIGLHIVQPDAELLRRRIADGYRFIAYGIDAVFLSNNAINPLKAATRG